jgi:hypothetical protein
LYVIVVVNMLLNTPTLLSSVRATISGWRLCRLVRRQRALVLLLNSSRTYHRQPHVVEVRSLWGRPAHNVGVNLRPLRRLPLVLRRPAGGMVNPGTHK